MVLNDDDDEIQFECVLPGPIKMKEEAHDDASEVNGSFEWNRSFDDGTENNNFESDEALGGIEVSTTSGHSNISANNNEEPAVETSDHSNVSVNNSREQAAEDDSAAQVDSSVASQQQNPSPTSIHDAVAGYIYKTVDVCVL